MKDALEKIIERIETWQNSDIEGMDDQDVLDSAEDTIMDIMRIACCAIKEVKT